MFKNRCRFVCAVACLFVAAFISLSAQSDPSTLPRINFADITYLGGFRLPSQFINSDGFTRGGYPITFNPSRNSLFIGSRLGNVAEVTIPTVVNSNVITQLPFATFLQGFYEPTEGTLSQIATNGEAAIAGLLVSADKLYGSASIYYDSTNTQRVSHYARSTTLSTTSVVGMRQVWLDEKTGFVSGYMAHVPVEWQAKLGGPAITGQCCLPIISRTSWGPSAFAFKPTDILTMAKVPATPLLYYPDSHPTLGMWDNSNPTYGGTTQITGVAIIAGSRTALFFGRTGTGPFCYGNGTNDPSLNGVMGPDGIQYCYDPTSAVKGQHAYPYNYQIWAYDLNDFAAVKAGTKMPWDIRPYGVWPFGLPFPEREVRIGGVGYDSSRQILYVSQLYGDPDGYGYRPVIHALKVGGGAVGTPLTPPDTTSLPDITDSTPTNPTITDLSLTANKIAPQPVGTTITFSADPTGGIAPQEYKWLMHNGDAWTAISGWSTSTTFNWTPTVANSQYRIGVWVRSSGNTTDAGEKTSSMDFPIGTSAGATSPYTKTVAASISSDKPAPQPAGTTITFKGTPSGGTAPHQYKWLVHDGAQWTAVTGWSTTNTFAWTPTIAKTGYRIGLWVRSAGATSDGGEATASIDYPISGSTTSPTPTPTPTTSTSRLLSVALTANRPEPQPAGTSITFSAVPNGGATPHTYKWLLHDGSSWHALSDWSTTSTYTWTPTAANSQYRFGVWVRSAGSTATTGEVTASIDFAITASTTTTTPPPPTSTTGTRLSAVTLSANKAEPQPQNTTITFTATPNGGATPQQYKWLLHDGDQWRMIKDWNTSNTFAWTPTAANSQYRIGVWVRSAGITTDTAEATSSVDFAITVGTTTTTATRVSSVALTSNRPAPQAAGTPITFTATPTGGVAPHQYKWLVHDGSTWRAVDDWSTSNTYTWTPTAANSQYRFGVWVRSAGNTVDAGEATVSIDFPISTAARLSSVTIGANKIAPQSTGSTITFTALPVGGVAPQQYKWLVHDGARWLAVTGWSTSSTFNWTPTIANPNYRIGVWVRSAGNTLDAGEVTASIDYPIR
jgi:N-acetylmuramoyl-L-alanine amidase